MHFPLIEIIIRIRERDMSSPGRSVLMVFDGREGTVAVQHHPSVFG
jgi:hypothetical protein